MVHYLATNKITGCIWRWEYTLYGLRVQSRVKN